MSEIFYAPVPRGLEEVLAQELSEIGAQNPQITDGGVRFSGPFTLCYKANLYSRLASRILWQVWKDEYSDEDDIYSSSYGIEWEKWFSAENKIRVDVVGKNCPLKSLQFATLRVKDGICDRFRGLSGKRPSVDTHNPDIRIHVFLDKKNMIVSIDTSGEPLFKRGLRHVSNKAPIRENLAAGILRIAGWKPGIPLLDPMCGSGTFLLEAVQMSLNIAPGSSRSFSFQKMKIFDAAAWQKIYGEAIAQEKDEEALPIFGSDLHQNALDAAEENFAQAGLSDCVKLEQSNILNVTKPAPEGIMVANMPYGERMGDKKDIQALYPKLGDLLKKEFAGWTAYLFTSDLKMPKSIRLSVSMKKPLFNAKLECRLFEYKMIAGSNRKNK